MVTSSKVNFNFGTPQDLCIILEQVRFPFPSHMMSEHQEETLLKTVPFLQASRSGDSTARIWTIGDGPCNSHMQNGPVNVMVLKHFKGQAIISLVVV
ncbi:hypothetical protein BC332_33761 [Capsicum chinense]|nr:hypothetical protein BC332_33761 [Capsicum chinense]